MEHSDILQQCETLKHIIKTQTEQTQAVGDQYLLTTLNQLSDTEKVELLKCLVKECLTSEECCERVKRQEQKPAIIQNPQKIQEDASIDSIEEYNQKELIRLKVWGIKLMIFSIFAMVIIIILVMIILGSGAIHSTNSVFDELQAIYSDLFN